ncbi:unnamed protein product [Blepharisma stoltei]|uniref:Uncharacterized protein n=1 Tax=Blepharisma stoltei TaxID=1481888 RepID=A0AAU9JH25_9CILI|nr:unnamed protein product [Blepharisma stoltei]
MTYYNRISSLGNRTDFHNCLIEDEIIHGDEIHSIRSVLREDFYQTFLFVYLESSFIYSKSDIGLFEKLIYSQQAHPSFQNSYESSLEIVRRLKSEGIDYLDNASTDPNFIKVFQDLSLCFSPFDSAESYLRKVSEKLWVSIYIRKENGQIFKIIKKGCEFSISIYVYNGSCYFLYPIQTSANDYFFQENFPRKIFASCGDGFDEEHFKKFITLCPKGHNLYSVEIELLNRNELKDPIWNNNHHEEEQKWYFEVGKVIIEASILAGIVAVFYFAWKGKN